MIQCPLPSTEAQHVHLSHGGGGRAAHQLVDSVFLKHLSNSELDLKEDSAQVGEQYVTTDLHVVNPIEFPGGDIGKLAVVGSVNDLLMAGCQPHSLTMGWILEEGLDLQLLEKMVRSVAIWAERAQVKIVAGDTKVVERGHADKIYISTTGIGKRWSGWPRLGAREMKEGDVLVVSGALGRHGMAILSARENLRFQSDIESDCKPMLAEVEGLWKAGICPHAMRDLTRGGLAGGLWDWAVQGHWLLEVEADVPVDPVVASGCELYGLDPWYLANEGTMLLAFSPDQAAAGLEVLRAHNSNAAIIGRVLRSHDHGQTLIRRTFGGHRILNLPWGDPLPRIC